MLKPFWPPPVGPARTISPIARLTHADDFPDKDFAQNCYTHNLAALVKLAGLEDQFGRQQAANPTFRQFWVVVAAWNEASRYTVIDAGLSRSMVMAVGDLVDGVLAWIRNEW